MFAPAGFRIAMGNQRGFGGRAIYMMGFVDNGFVHITGGAASARTRTIHPCYRGDADCGVYRQYHSANRTVLKQLNRIDANCLPEVAVFR